MNKSLKKAIDVLSEAGFAINSAKVETWQDLGFKDDENRLRYHYATGYITLRIAPENAEEKVYVKAMPPV